MNVFSEFPTNCRHGAIFNMLLQYGRDIGIFLGNYIPLLHIRENIVGCHYAYRLPLAELLISTGIRETRMEFTENLEGRLNTWPRGKTAIIKTDLFAQRISRMHFNRQHFRHNLFIYGCDGQRVAAIEHEYGGSDRYFAQIFDVDEVCHTYYSYVNFFYKSGMDTEDTYAEYEDIGREEIASPKRRKAELLDLVRSRIGDLEAGLAMVHQKLLGGDMSTSHLNASLKNLTSIKMMELCQNRRILEIPGVESLLGQQISALERVKAMAMCGEMPDREVADFLAMESDYLERLVYRG